MMRRVLSVLWVLGSAACGASEIENDPERGPAMTAASASDLERVRQGRILFSHHSVGMNLLAGLQRMNARVGGGALNVVPLERAKASAGPSLIEISGGRNTDPKSKVDFFRETIRTHALEPELAFMKFCYVDFEPSTDVDGLFAYYRTTMDALKREHPEIKFAHVTVPLVSRPMELKARLFRLIGRPVWEDSANVKRHQFNQRLLREYAADPVFDLAKVESTRPDGTRETFELEGQVYYSMVPRYTSDHGHLNDRGQDAAAPELVRFLADALTQQPDKPRS
jgi:hypothetical protein